ncbi:ribonuclease HII [Oceanirhabdus sp. W0125-5]|uniref:ribonuclease HII n=1 Tax=Oceanirhabdus sp. W0125-5 TaxID=2999116 RepID=UPI0022F2AE8B|nr:ribonuclease HII [Oceanirhabdus sp. W0125-5]WBW94815.1 ribonuclease HII [Oceanirhabdus sp. W0125-5]
MIKDLGSLKVKEIKDIVKIELEKMYASKDVDNITKLVSVLDEDGRSAVKSLKVKCEKEITKLLNEIERVKKLYEFDINHNNGVIIAGVDEVGRGPLAGPIVGAAVVLDYSSLEVENLILGINDSKKIKECERERLYDEIIKRCVDYKIVGIDNGTIDSQGIAWCNNEIFKNSILGLDVKPDKVLCDGYSIKNFNIDNEAVIKGDTKSAAIACASILAKVYRDRIMKEYSKKYPEYDFESNVGYGTQKHIEALRKCGHTDIHRKSFIRNLINV